jgi:hypothetical protein
MPSCEEIVNFREEAMSVLRYALRGTLIAASGGGFLENGSVLQMRDVLSLPRRHAILK